MKKIIISLFVLILLLLSSCATNRNVAVIELNYKDEFSKYLLFYAISPEAGEIIGPACFSNNRVIFSNLPNAEITFVCDIMEQGSSPIIYGWHNIKKGELPCKVNLSSIIPSNTIDFTLYNIPKKYNLLRVYRVISGNIDELYRTWAFPINRSATLGECIRAEYIVVAIRDHLFANDKIEKGMQYYSDLGYMKFSLENVNKSKVKIRWEETKLSSKEKKYVSEHYESVVADWFYKCPCRIVYEYSSEKEIYYYYIASLGYDLGHMASYFNTVDHWPNIY